MASGKCPSCKGTGKCQTCGGTGTIPGPDGKPMKCPSCSGSGKCPRCGGSGIGSFGLIPGGSLGAMSGMQGQGGSPPQGGPNSPANMPRWGGVRATKNPTRTINTRIRARKLAAGMIDQIFIRGLPPGDCDIKMKYVTTLEEVGASRDSVRERDHIPREDKELVKQYHNSIKGIE